MVRSPGVQISEGLTAATAIMVICLQHIMMTALGADLVLILIPLSLFGHGARYYGADNQRRTADGHNGRLFAHSKVGPDRVQDRLEQGEQRSLKRAYEVQSG